MAFSSSDAFSYDIQPDFDYTIDEKGNMFMALRKIKWGSSDEYKLDLRKYVSSDNGEKMMKGCTFMSDDGAHELTKVMLEIGYGHPDEIVDTIKNNRPDVYAQFVKDIKEIPDDKVTEILDQVDDYYDMRSVI